MDIPFFRFPYFEIGNTVYCNLARILLGQGPLDLIFELPRRHDKRGAQKPEAPHPKGGEWVPANLRRARGKDARGDWGG